ncbi:condensation domain-containing protein [Streptosporangium canum]|uniref:condensation domain-containing protein n=1 Tax=Streptosporangium canum TaxID=324952 RepID=UPI00342C707C
MTVHETTHAPDDLEIRTPLAFNQEFLCAFDNGEADGAFGNRHTLVFGWRLSGAVDVGALQGALDDVVARHEALRTSIVRGAEERYQRIHPPGSVELVVSDLPADDPRPRDVRAEEFLNELDAGTYSVGSLPHLRARLGRFDENDAVLVLVLHHTAGDAWSMQVIIRDLAARYAVRRGSQAPVLPDVHQYGEFAVWQLESAAGAEMGRALEYWGEKLRDARILAIPTDRPRDGGLTNVYAAHRFVFDGELTSATLKFSRAARSSAFMVMVAAYNVLLHKKTGVTDIVVPTFTSGRSDERFMETVGPIFNYLTLRTDITGCETFRDVVARTRATCFEAYGNDIPFPLIAHGNPGLVSPFADDGVAVVAFEVLQAPSEVEEEAIGGLTYSEIRRRVLPQPLSSHIPNGALWAMDVLPSGEIAGSLKFDRNRFDESTIVDLVSDFRQVLWNAVTGPDRPLREI